MACRTFRGAVEPFSGGSLLDALGSLDKGDNDPTRFLSYLVAALQSIVEEEIGESVLSSLPSPQPPIEALVTTLLNQIVELPAELILILEDYHVIDSELVHGPPPFYEVTRRRWEKLGRRGAAVSCSPVFGVPVGSISSTCVATPPLGDMLFSGERLPHGLTRGFDLGVHDDPIICGHHLDHGSGTARDLGSCSSPKIPSSSSPAPLKR